MVVANVKGPLKAPNHDILNAVRNKASMEYRERIPVATQANIAEVHQELTEFTPAYNEFAEALVNRIGKEVVRGKSWSNPLSIFKKGMLPFGTTIEEIAIGLLEAKVYDPDREYLERDIYGTVRPRVESNFHQQNRRDMYKITINRDLLKQAFLNDGGLSDFINRLMETPTTSDEVDEFKIMVNLIRQHERSGGFHHIHVDDVAAANSTEAEAKQAIRTIRSTIDNLAFVTTDFNAAGMPTHSQKDDLVLITTPEFKSGIDVNALAAAFNLDPLSLQARMITIPERDIGIPGFQAALVDEEFFVVYDTLLENTTAENPVALSTNFWLHHWGLYSSSRFVTAIMFHTGDTDVLPSSVERIAAVGTLSMTDWEGNAIVATTGTVERGGVYQVSSDGTAQALIYSVDGGSGKTEITNYGVLSVAQNEPKAELTVTATTASYDGENLRQDAQTSTFKVKVGGTYEVWPQVGKPKAIVFGGDARIALVDGTDAYNLPSTWEAWTPDILSTVKVESTGPVSTVLSVADKVLTVGIDPAYGQPIRNVKVTLTAPPA